MVAALAADRPIGVAIMAMGGQGGGVLADWIVAMAETEGFVAQSTSVPGVAQRTGATIYYVEMIRAAAGRTPVLSLMPVPGNVDVVVAAELMEAGRAIQRGFVSGRTVLIASSHRAYATTEKIAPGDGIADPVPVLAAARDIAAHFVCADMQAIADRAGSVISAALFGALAASGALPFPRQAFERTIRVAGIGVRPSLRAFAAGLEAATTPAVQAARPAALILQASGGTPEDQAEFARAVARIDAFPAPARDMLRHGVRRMVDWQDVAYAHEYLDRMETLRALDDEVRDWALTTEAARQVAVAMAYDDVIRVADLKTRAGRHDRVRGDVQAGAGRIVETIEYMHPRVEEICATLPAGLGVRVEGSAIVSRLLGLLFARGRRVRTTGITGFALLWMIAGLRPRRRTLLRHRREMARLEAWLDLVRTHARSDTALAVEILKCRRLVKGYSDTHARGAGKFDRVLGALPLLAGRADAADWIRRLHEAALADEEGRMLDGALKTVATLGEAA